MSLQLRVGLSLRRGGGRHGGASSAGRGSASAWAWASACAASACASTCANAANALRGARERTWTGGGARGCSGQRAWRVNSEVVLGPVVWSGRATERHYNIFKHLAWPSDLAREGEGQSGGGCGGRAEKNRPPPSPSGLLSFLSLAACRLLPCLVLGWFLASLPTRALQLQHRFPRHGQGLWLFLMWPLYGEQGWAMGVLLLWWWCRPRWLSLGCHSLTSLPRVSPAWACGLGSLTRDPSATLDLEAEARRDRATGGRRACVFGSSDSDSDSGSGSDGHNQDTTRHTRRYRA